MARTANTKEDYRTLFAKTGNQCAFPGCNHPLIDEDNEFVAQVCHIEAAEPGGQRYNAEMTDEDRRSVENLIVLCHRHHVKTNNTNLYTVQRLRGIKADHEANWAERLYQLPDQAVDQIFEEQLLFEREVSRINAAWRESFDMAMDLQFFNDPSRHLEEVSASIADIERLLAELSDFLDKLPNDIGTFFGELGYDLTNYREVPYYENPFHNAFWEMMSLGVPNFLSRIRFHSKALEVHIEIQKLRARPSDTSIRTMLDGLKSQLSELASTLAHVD